MSESQERSLRGAAEEIPPKSTRDKNPSHGERRISPSESVRKKRNGKIGQ